MATVDFSNATLEFLPSENERTYTTGHGKPLGVNSASFAKRLHTYDLDSVASVGKAVVTDTPSKWVCNYVGTFTQEGTEIYIVDAYTQGYGYWGVIKITNISFAVGDDFDFDIEITYSGD